jgi:hypothetical protein
LSLGIALADFSTLRAEADGFKQKAAPLDGFLHFQLLQQPNQCDTTTVAPTETRS